MAQATLCYMGTQLPSLKRGQSPSQFSAHVYCGQAAGWIKMTLGMEMGCGPGHIVLDGDTEERAQQPPLCDPCLLWPNGWMHQDATSYGGRPHPGHVVLDRDQLPLKKGAHPPIFGPCLLWPNGWMHQDTTWYGGRPQRRPTSLC